MSFAYKHMFWKKKYYNFWMVCNVVGFDDSELTVGFIKLKSQLYLQRLIYNHIFHFSTLPKYSFLVFLTTSAYFFSLGMDLPVQYVLLCVTSKWSSHETLLPFIQMKLHPTLSLIIQSYKNIPFLTAVLNFVIFWAKLH